MEEASKAQNRTLELDWNTLLPRKDDDEPVSLIIVKADTSVSDSEAHSGKNSDTGSDQQHPSEDGVELLSDQNLLETIQRQKHTLSTMARKLNDGGVKVRNKIKRLEEELERRKTRMAEKKADKCEKPGKVTSSSTVGVSRGLKKEDMSSRAHSKSSFAACFYKKITEDTDCVTVNEFDKESPVVKHCDNLKAKENGVSSQKGRKRDRSSARQLAFQCHDTSDNSKTCRSASPFSPCHNQKNLSGCFPKNLRSGKVVSQAIQLDDSKSRKPIVLDDDIDEDESHLVDKTKQEDKFAKHLKDAKIYYPSRDDPESVEICFKDMDCLAPEGYLTSTIMNFYIQYLQQQESLTNMSTSDYHFFNTYFYKKLTEAVSYKRSDREGFFVKFRRWWKGVNIFHKAYILIPIHEDLHWSLVIICIPDKDDESWPIILHLDSLGLHYSRSIFENIRSFLIEEWKYVERECESSDIPIADRIWKNLSRGIEEKILKVPQQKNDYDCGLFVLYFIQRFMEEAPERLKKKDLAKFGKQWFKPEEASSLRLKIHCLLREKFHDLCNHESSPESSPQSVSATESVEPTDNS